MNAVVRVENGEADVWTGSQGPPAAQGLVARYAGLDVEQVRSHQTTSAVPLAVAQPSPM